MKIGKKIQELRGVKEITQEELAKTLGIAQSTLANYERGARSVPVELIPLIAKYFDVTTDYLFDLEI